MIDTLGPAFLVPRIEAVFTHFATLLQEKTASQRIYLEQNAIIVGVEAANTHPLATSAMDTLGSLITAMGANPSFLPFYQQAWQSSLAFFTLWNAPDDLISCYALASTLLETFGPDAGFVVDAVLKMVPDTVRSPKEFCRANSFYALNLIMKHFPAAFASYLGMAAKVLEAGLEGMPGDVGAGSGGKE